MAMSINRSSSLAAVRYPLSMAHCPGTMPSGNGRLRWNSGTPHEVRNVTVNPTVRTSATASNLERKPRSGRSPIFRTVTAETTA